MYYVLECHSKPINVPTDTNICLYKHQLVINLLITLHSFLTRGNKACDIVEQISLALYCYSTVTLM